MKFMRKFHYPLFFLVVITTFFAVSNADAQAGRRDSLMSGGASDEAGGVAKVFLEPVHGSATINIAQHYEPGGPWWNPGPGADLAANAARLDAAETAALLILLYQVDEPWYFDFELEGPFNSTLSYIGTSVVNGVPCFQYRCELFLHLYAHSY